MSLPLGNNLNFPIFPFLADQMDTPNTADWAVNAFALLDPDSNNDGFKVRLFDDTLEEGIGLELDTPLNATNIIFEFKSRAETGAASNLGVRPKLYAREAPNNLIVESWDAGTLLDALTMGTSNEFLQYDIQTITLASLNLVAGRKAQFEITRLPSDGSDTLVGDWALSVVKVSFT